MNNAAASIALKAPDAPRARAIATTITGGNKDQARFAARLEDTE